MPKMAKKPLKTVKNIILGVFEHFRTFSKKSIFVRFWPIKFTKNAQKWPKIPKIAKKPQKTAKNIILGVFEHFWTFSKKVDF